MDAIKRLSAAARVTIDAIARDLNDSPLAIARRGNSRRTIALIPASHDACARLSSALPATQKTVWGVAVVETLAPRRESLSVRGIYLQSTDTMAPRTTIVRVLAADDGRPDILHLCRDGGRVARACHDWT